MESNFITIYTDASYSQSTGIGQIAYYGFCNYGIIKGALKIYCSDNNIAEMEAIRYAIKHTLETFPEVEGFFINSDNQCSVNAILNRKEDRISIVTPSLKKTLVLVDIKWFHAKWVKGHDYNQNIRSILNNIVDKMTRSKKEFKIHKLKNKKRT